ncbi:MAG: hypothetical protein WCF36_07660 [Candidatus Nanopelagicales bacterium]
MIMLLVFRASPKIAFVCWMLTVGFVPVWFAVPLIASWMPATLAGILVLAATYPWGERRLGVPDALVAAFFAACFMPIFVPGAWSPTSVVVAISQWGLAFLLGRLLLGRRLRAEWIYGVIALVMAGVALMATLEFLLHWNPFVGLSPPWNSSSFWRGLQERGGLLRAEGAFGHSIALGCSLALAVPLAIGSRFRLNVRLALVAILAVAAVLTFSRLGIFGVLLGFLLSMVVGSALSGRARLTALAVATLAAVLLGPRVLDVFTGASTEAAGSARYRLDLLELVPNMATFGFSDAGRVNPQGELTFFQFQSIDSALLLLGLVYGLVALALAIALLVLAVRSVVLRTAEPPTIAVVAQIPALMTVALITQYAMLFWLVAGLAVAAHERRPDAVVGHQGRALRGHVPRATPLHALGD